MRISAAVLLIELAQNFQKDAQMKVVLILS